MRGTEVQPCSWSDFCVPALRVFFLFCHFFVQSATLSRRPCGATIHGGEIQKVAVFVRACGTTCSSPKGATQDSKAPDVCNFLPCFSGTSLNGPEVSRRPV